MNAADWITGCMPTTPEPDPCDYRTSSAPCLIQTVNGGLYTAQMVVYTDQDADGIPPCWELFGREGLQIDPEEVVAWQPIVRYVVAA